MQEQKIDTILYIAIQINYENIQIGLFNKKSMLDNIIILKSTVSRDFIPTLNLMLEKNKIKLDDLTFLCCNQGPGPFTMLRLVITFMNALNFGGNLPLIGIDGLDAFIEEFSNKNWPITVALLNAYNNDVYFAIEKNGVIIKKSWENINKLLDELNNNFPNTTIRFIGSGANFYREQINSKLNNLAYIEVDNPQNCSLNQIAKLSIKNWIEKQNIFKQLMPLYLKDPFRFKKEV